jgi:uncharacterized membrane protein
MTPEQVTKRMGWMYAMIGGGIACLYMAYDYAKPWVPGTEPAPEWAPYLFGILGIVLLIVGIVMWVQLKKQPTPPATTDLKGPQGKLVITLLVIGAIALAGTYLIDYVVPSNDGVGLALNIGLLLVMIVCFVSAGYIARKMRAAVAAGAAKK